MSLFGGKQHAGMNFLKQPFQRDLVGRDLLTEKLYSALSKETRGTILHTRYDLWEGEGGTISRSASSSSSSSFLSSSEAAASKE